MSEKGPKPVISQENAERIAETFHFVYYHYNDATPVWYDTTWLGVPIYKTPFDLWNYQEILFEQKPDVIIETGAAAGGSLLYYKTLCWLLGKGEVIGVDIEIEPTAAKVAENKGVTLLEGSSTDPAIIDRIRELVAGRTAIVILDSDHSCGHVLAELRLYKEFVPLGGYMIVEDSNVNGHPVYPHHGPGPYEAIDLFLEENGEFEIDSYRCNKFLMTFNPNGYLKRVK
jgi:cephalosporin hydroxylase